MGDKVEKQLPRVVTFYDQIGTTPEIVTRAYGQSWVSSKTGDGAVYPFCYLKTLKFGNINCVTVKTGDPIEDINTNAKLEHVCSTRSHQNRALRLCEAHVRH